MSSAQPLHDQLTALQEAQKAACQKHEKAKYRLEREYHVKAREVVRNLAQFRDDCLFKRPKAIPVEDRPERERNLTVEFCKTISENPDLVLRPLGNSDTLSVVDLSVDRDHRQANYDFVAARRARLAFESEQAEGLKAEIAAQEMKEINDALSGSDPAKVREVLSVGK